MRGAVGDADVIVLVSDVYGEPLADAKIMQKWVVTSCQLNLKPAWSEHACSEVINK